MPERGWVNILVTQLLTQLAPAVLVDPDSEELIQALCRDIKDELARLLGVFFKGNFAPVCQADVTVRRGNNDRDPFPDRLRRFGSFLPLGLRLWLGTLLFICRVTIELG